MKATVPRALAKSAVEVEIETINKQIEAEALKGHTEIGLSDVSQGAMAYLKDEGYDTMVITFDNEHSQVIVRW